MIEEQSLKEKIEEATEPRSLEQIETDFRESRIITTPVFGMVDTNNFKGKPKIEKIRLVIKNWDTLDKIPADLMSRGQVYTYRSNIKKYLNGEKTKLSKRVFPLIEEYRDFLLEHSKGKEKLKRKIFVQTEKFLTKKYAENIGKMKFILENWKTPKKALSIMSQVSINGYRKRVHAYLKGKTDKVPVHYHKLIEQHKDAVLNNLNPRVKNLEPVQCTQTSKRRGGRFNEKALREILENWEDKTNWINLGITKSSYWNYRSRITKYFKGEKVPEAYTPILEEYRNKLPVSITGAVSIQKSNPTLKISATSISPSASVNYPYYKTTDTSYGIPSTQSIPCTQSTEALTKIKKEVKPNTEDFSVSFIEQLQRLGVKEFIIRF